jgi:ribosomal protein S18 acetylase RimI-like enzyme
LATFLINLPPQDMQRRLPDALGVYVDAMRYPRGTENQRAAMWLEHTRRRGWQAVAAVEVDVPAGATPSSTELSDAPLLGVAYGYCGAPDQWWQQQVVVGLQRGGLPGPEIAKLMARYFELTELHIHPRAQGQGLGEALARRLLADRSPCSRPGRAAVWHDDLVRASGIQLLPRGSTARRRQRLMAMTMLLLVIPVLAGCVRIRASITISPDDLVSGEIIAAAKPRNDKDAGPQLDPNLPFSQKVAVSKYDRDGYVGSQAVFSDLTFAELPELANMNSDAQGVNLSLRRAGDLVILEGRADLTSLTDPDADVELSVAFPGTVTSTNGDRVDPDTVQWKLKPGAVSSLTAQARYTDPSTRSFTGAALWLGLSSLVVAAAVGLLAWYGRDRSPRVAQPSDPPPN